MNILSLFDGMSCGQQALERAGIKVDNYFASEIDKYAIQVTMANYPNTKQLGSVVDVDGYSLPKIDILIGGSPCQSFSFAGKRKGMSTKDEQEILTLNHYLQLKSEGYEFEGQSYLFWEYMRLLNEVKPKYFLLENVMMGEKWEKILSKAIGVNPIMINSSLVSAQNRKRLYWTNIGMQPMGLFGDMQSIIEQPKDKGILLKDILESEVDEKYYLSERMINSFEIKTDKYKQLGGGFAFKPSEGENKSRTLTNPGKNRMDDNFIVHNTMPRSSRSGKGGTGHLTRADGKTYCLDTGNTNAVELPAIYDDYNGNIRKDGKTCTLTINSGSKAERNGQKVILDNNSVKTKPQSPIRRLTPIECERLQTVKDNYTNHVSDSQRYKMLGNGWTVDVIAHIFSYI
jgi:DNA-cytosine methyltransferase